MNLRDSCTTLAWAALSAGAGCWLCGCAQHGPRPKAMVSPQTNQPPISPVITTPARVMTVNSRHKSVVIDFGGRVVPAVGTRLRIFRGETRVGMVRITDPGQGRFAPADVLEGELKPGDDVR